jgi:hypothetical protein
MRLVTATFVASALWLPLWAASRAHSDAAQAAFVKSA